MSYAITFVLGFLAAAAALAIALRYARPWGLVDHPVGRKAHTASTPVIGGIGLVAALTAAVLYRPGILNDHLGFVIACVLLSGVGVYDDIRPISARYKLLAQLLACCLAIGLDKVLVGQLGADLFGLPMGLGVFSAPFTLLVMLTVLNGFNLIDGVDGVAGGMALVALALFAKASFTAGLPFDSVLVAGLLGGLTAFLCINFPFRRTSRAKTFLGDAGSLLLGFALVYFAVRLSAIPHRVFRPTTALWFFAIPVFDAVWLYLRRTWYGRQPFRAGRDHLHHLLMRRWTARTASLGMIAAAAVAGGASYLAERLHVGPIEHLVVWLAAFLGYGLATHRPWRAEWSLAEQALLAAAAPPPSTDLSDVEPVQETSAVERAPA